MKDEIREKIKLHQLWLKNEEGGVYAFLRGANLSCADLEGADLRGANLSCADLRGANLSHADLEGANLSCADLRGADLRGAFLRGANLSHADLEGANPRGADLSCADLRGANLSCALEGANLRGADLRCATGDGRRVKTYQLFWPVVLTATHMSIGCQSHSLRKWGEFTDQEISKMGEGYALNFWREYKEFLLKEATKCDQVNDDGTPLVNNNEQTEGEDEND